MVLIGLGVTVSSGLNVTSNTMLSKITAIHRTGNPSPLFVAKSLEGNEFCPHQKTVLTSTLGTRKQSFRPMVLLDTHENVFF